MNFPLTEVETKPKNLKTPWFRKRLKKCSKTKQRLYIKFLKSKALKLKQYIRTKKLFSKAQSKVKEKLIC